MITTLRSWGRTPQVHHADVRSMTWTDQTPDFRSIEGSVLPVGYRRSYGDSCLNENGTLIDCTAMHRILNVDEQQLVIRCEAGVRLDEILSLIVPRGLFLPVTPGTQMVSVGGAIANDVHGKNHHSAGSFGSHVICFELLRSDGSRILCSPTENPDWFSATIGGLGLTGIITWAEFRLIRIPSPYLLQHSIRFQHVDEYLEHSRESDKIYPYVVSWIDCSATGSRMGRGIFMGGSFVDAVQASSPDSDNNSRLVVPFDFPSFTMNKWTMRLASALYYHRQFRRESEHRVHYRPFFYPLDGIEQWNRAYGAQGFFQYQFVVPFESAKSTLHQVLANTAKHGKASFVSVLKNFGSIASPGMLSFPFEGVTLALDFRNEGSSTLKMMNELDAIVEHHGGRLYPAKDARMSASHFRKAYPQWLEFQKYIDPKFSSSFWRRVSS